MVKVSVIIPAYNAEKYIAKCLNSLVGQTLEDIEIIIVNDGSTDNTLAIIEDYHEKYGDKIVYKSVENGGAASARNIALKMAKGEYVGFVDSDDDVSYTMFEKMYRLASMKNADIVTCGYNKIDIDFVQKKDIKLWECFGHSVHEAPDLFLTNVPFIWNKIFRRSLIEENEIAFEETLSIYEDMVFTYKLFLKANKVERVSEALYNYVAVRAGSLTHVFSPKRFHIFKAYDILIDFYNRNGAFEKFKDELLFILLDHIFVVMNGAIQAKRYLMMQKYISDAFNYLNKTFPEWKNHKRYFAKRRKKKKTYTSKLYWRFIVAFPKSIKVAKVTWENFKKHRLGFTKVGNCFIKAYNEKPISEKSIIISSQHGDNLNGNMFYILKELCSNSKYADYEIGLVYKKGKKESFQKLLDYYGINQDGIKWLLSNSYKHAEFLATAKYLFNDTSFPVYFIKKEEQVYLNTWHGTPLKKLGRGQDSDYHDIANLQKNFMASDFLLYPNEYMKEHMLDDYMIREIYDGDILMSGYPRNEIFFDLDKSRSIRNVFDISSKQAIAYMPTWRGSVRAVDEQVSIIEGYLREIDVKLQENQIMFVNLHPYVADKLDYTNYQNIKPFPEHLETYEFLNACDVLVTDYSSVFFDFAITGRKIVLFAYDEEDYMRSRGMYMKLDDLPFTKVSNVNDLIDELNNSEIGYGDEFINEFCAYEREDMSSVLCNLVIGGNRNDLDILKPEKKDKKKHLIHLDSLYDGLVVDKIVDIVNNTDLESELYYSTYNSEQLMGKEKYLKLFSGKMNYYGRFGRFKAATLIDKALIMLIDKHAWVYKLFKKAVNDIFDIERKRAFVNCNFDTHIVLADDSLSNICFALSLTGKKILYIPNLIEVNKNIPKWIYEEFDAIVRGKDVESLEELVNA